MKLVSWNVNGLRSCLDKGFLEFLENSNSDVFCVQETKMKPHQNTCNFEKLGYREFWNSAQKPGYSGTLTLSRIKPVKVEYGMGVEVHDKEGRIVNTEFDKFFLVNVYTPNAQAKLARLSYRKTWEDDFRKYLGELRREKPVIVCGDLNVAHREMDLANPRANKKNPGFSEEERGKINELLESGFVDSFRHFYPNQAGQYTWWSYMSKSRERNVGWRIDYFLVSESIVEHMKTASIYSEIVGSDHCPVGIEIDM